MSPKIDTIVDEIVASTYKPPRSGQYSPTLVVGLGGTGLRALRHLKGLLRHHEGNMIQLLAIDSDSEENGKYPELPQLVPREELVILDQDVAVRSLARAAQGRTKDDRYILEFLPDTHEKWKGLHNTVKSKIRTQQGAGQFRRAGRLLFCTNVNGGAGLDNILTKIYNRMLGMDAVADQTAKGVTVKKGAKVYVISSVSGGTGAGCLLDCIGLLRKQFSGPQDIITALCVLPGEQLDSLLTKPKEEEKGTRGNAVAILRELQALLMNAMDDFTFKFDSGTTFENPGNLIDDVYLVDQQNMAKTPANSYMELCQAVGYFVYSLVGSGVGAAKESGNVNGQIPDQQREDKRLFNSLGVGVIDYPIFDLGRYAVRRTLEDWLRQWLQNSESFDEINSSVESLLAGLSLNSVQTLRGKIQPARNDIPRSRFMKSKSERDRYVKSSDSVFLSKGNEVCSSIDSELEQHDGRFEESMRAFMSDIGGKVHSWALATLGAGGVNATNQIEALQSAIRRLNTDLATDRNQREEALRTTLNAKADLEKVIDRRPGVIFEKKQREEYVSTVDRYLQMKLEEKADGYLQNAVDEVRAVVRTCSTQCANLIDKLETLQSENRRILNRISDQTDVRGFVHSAIPCEEFDNWVAKNLSKVSKFELSSFDLEQLVTSALEGPHSAYQKKLAGLDIIADAKNDPELRNRIKAVDAAALPMIHLEITAPEINEMSPQKFLAAKLSGNKDPILEHFPGLGAANTSGIKTTNPHVAICSQTIHGFRIIDWSHFQSAENCYRERPWIYHSLGAPDDFPAVQLVTADEAKNLERFGLGMMFELIDQRGQARYYKNLNHSDRDKKYYFNTYRELRSTPATVLLSSTLIAEPDRSQSKFESENLLGNSLEKSFQVFQRPDCSAFQERLQDLIEEFVGLKGKGASAELVQQYARGDLDTLMGRASDDGRRELLGRIKEALLNYAAELS